MKLIADCNYKGNEGLHQELKNLNLESVFSHYANHIKSQGGQLY